MTDILALLIPITAIVAVAVILIVALRLRFRRRELLHRERLAAIEKGMEIPEALLAEPDSLSPHACLLRGLIWLLSGLAVIVFFVAMGFAEGDREIFAAAALGLIPAGAGIAYLVVYRKAQAESGPRG
jgi:hypothetical protein